MGFLNRELPQHLPASLNPRFELRPYQAEAFARFLHCVGSDYPGKDWPLHIAFNMATGSGKTLIMAGLIAHLYAEGYRHFLFFVNSTNIIEKTRDNFLNPTSAKYLFTPRLEIGGRPVRIAEVANFADACPDDINICFTTIQKLHMDLTAEREDAITYEDFKGKRVVLIADEAFVADRDWYVFNANYGTAEEKAFVRLFERQVEVLQETYSGIYLARPWSALLRDSPSRKPRSLARKRSQRQSCGDAGSPGGPAPLCSRRLLPHDRLPRGAVPLRGKFHGDGLKIGRRGIILSALCPKTAVK